MKMVINRNLTLVRLKDVLPEESERAEKFLKDWKAFDGTVFLYAEFFNVKKLIKDAEEMGIKISENLKAYLLIEKEIRDAHTADVYYAENDLEASQCDFADHQDSCYYCYNLKQQDDDMICNGGGEVLIKRAEWGVKIGYPFLLEPYPKKGTCPLEAIYEAKKRRFEKLIEPIMELEKKRDDLLKKIYKEQKYGIYKTDAELSDEEQGIYWGEDDWTEAEGGSEE